MREKSKVCAVLVSYNPDLKELKSNLLLIINQVEKLFVVDNSERPLNIDEITNISSKIEWISVGRNKGIGAAQNLGIQSALKENFDSILILDQDSTPPQNMVEGLVTGISDLKGQGKNPACIGPEVYNKNTKEAYTPLLNKGVSFDSIYIEKDSMISSGTLIPTDAIREIGLMEEGLFIDLVDFEWCWRAKEIGYKCYVTKNVRMGHMVGQKNITIMGVYTLLVPSPIRHYYQFRNTILLMKRSYVPTYWKFRTVIERAIDMIAYPLFIYPRSNRLRYILKGLLDGLSGKKGKFIDDKN
ncbi:glycosyltransferase family 2 protein [Robertmurraya korlensis]|uniref:glycosyltransferase family 2 protein n=1 Tax=Robertmurraya korlensis TaxID=519977 RepID=UPI000824013D|nr:glycosyltransferase family 2 protein [Robertmurraya korlensis]